jgi:hypothetical protein
MYRGWFRLFAQPLETTKSYLVEFNYLQPSSTLVLVENRLVVLLTNLDNNVLKLYLSVTHNRVK